jgi:DNA-binding MarR family transcriptional regulator
MVDQGDIWEKLQEMDNKLDHIQGDVNSLATINKQDNRELLLELFQRKFGRSKNQRRIWYHADEKLTVDELADRSGLSESQIYNNITEMRERGLLVRTQVGDTSRYRRAEITEGIGLEEHVEEYVGTL